jgi:hypothetical protein
MVDCGRWRFSWQWLQWVGYGPFRHGWAVRVSTRYHPEALARALSAMQARILETLIGNQHDSFLDRP